MVWFASSWAAALIYGPAAAAGALLPYVTLRPPQPGIRDLVAGTTLLHAVGAAVLAWLGARSAFIHAIWAAGGLASLLLALPMEVGGPLWLPHVVVPLEVGALGASVGCHMWWCTWRWGRLEAGAPVVAATCGVLSCRRCLLQALLTWRAVHLMMEVRCPTEVMYQL